MSPLLTVAEQSLYRATSRHEQVLQFIAALAPQSDLLAVQSMGQSGSGQDIPVLVLSRARAFTPAAAHALGVPVVLVLANIHAGEVEGKECVLMLARDILTGPLARLIERATLLLVPDYNPDGNDRIDPSHRQLDLVALEGQIGPECGVGTRNTAQGYNLNRDYIKLESIEARQLAQLYGRWRPHLTVDCHTTNGSIHGYHLTFDTSHLLGSGPRGPVLYVRDVMLPRISRSLEQRTGHRTFFYGNFRNQDDPTQGWETYPGLPRFGSHYRGLTGRMDILLEAYSYIPFADRCRVMYAILQEILDDANQHGLEIVRLVRQAEDETVARGLHPQPDDLVGINHAQIRRNGAGGIELSYPTHPLGEPVEILAWDLDSQRARRVPGDVLTRYRTTYYGAFVPAKSVRRPFAYLLPAAAARIAEHLRLHNLHVDTVARDFDVDVESFVVHACERTASKDIADQAPPETLFFGHWEVARATAQRGDFVVPMAQPFAHLAIYLLEPESDDGLVQWGFFDHVRAGEWFPVRRIVAPT
ncbi:MAG: M14 family metallopeptidase [Planctomycetota bacterium]